MRTRSITVPSLLVLAVVSIVCAFARPAAAVADMDPPVLTNLRVEISDGPTAEPGETVTFTFDITDATGVGSVLFCVSGPESGDGHMLYAKRVEGTTWQVVWNVTDGDRPGVWRISYISYEDSSPLRNSKTDWPGKSGPTVTVTNPKTLDMDPPVLTNLRVEISDGPTAEPGETVTFTFDITDATGVGSVLFCVSGPESGDGHMLYAKRVEGTTWQVVWNVTDGDRPGVWRISYISYEDSSPLRNSKTDWPGESGPTVTVTYPEPVPPTSMEEIIQSIITMILNFIAQIVAAFGSLW